MPWYDKRTTKRYVGTNKNGYTQTRYVGTNKKWIYTNKACRY